MTDANWIEWAVQTRRVGRFRPILKSGYYGPMTGWAIR